MLVRRLVARDTGHAHWPVMSTTIIIAERVD